MPVVRLPVLLPKRCNFSKKKKEKKFLSHFVGSVSRTEVQQLFRLCASNSRLINISSVRPYVGYNIMVSHEVGGLLNTFNVLKFGKIMRLVFIGFVLDRVTY